MKARLESVCHVCAGPTALAEAPRALAQRPFTGMARSARDFAKNWTFSQNPQNFARPYDTVARGSSPARNFRASFAPFATLLSTVDRNGPCKSL